MSTPNNRRDFYEPQLFHDHFQNFKSYNIPRAQLVIADVPYNLGKNAYASNPSWYKDGDNKNGEAQSADAPIGSQTTHDRFSVATPVIVDMSHPGDPNDERRVSGGGDPMKTITTRNNFAVCTPLVLGQHGGAACRPIDDPCPTIATAGAIRMATPIILDMSRPGGHDSGHVRSADKPIQTLTTCDNVQVATPVIFDEAVGLPRLPDGRYIDILLRMLKPSELAAAHSFPKDYVLTGNRGEQVKQIGNSVPVMTAAAMCEVDFKEVA